MVSSLFSDAGTGGRKMMSSVSSGAHSFVHFDLGRVPSPCFVIDLAVLRHNLEILRMVQRASGAQILLALKAFSMWSLAPLISDYLSGICASGLWEARLGRQYYGGLVSTYAPAYRASEVSEIATLSDQMVFNTPSQLERWRDCLAVSSGLRLNPEIRQDTPHHYDPCVRGSRLGWPIRRFLDDPSIALSGVHIHALCEKDFSPLAQVFDSLRPVWSHLRGRIDWLNFGGGHLITSPNYQREALISFLASVRADIGAQLYLEPGEAIALDAGILVGEVLDVTENDGKIAVLDISATCHMPDVLEAPYRPSLLGEVERDTGISVQLAGTSCLAGDIIGKYDFAIPPVIGDRLAFLDQAHYSMVKTTTFNGMQLPSIAIWDSVDDSLKIQRRFSYDDFVGRLS